MVVEYAECVCRFVGAVFFVLWLARGPRAGLMRSAPHSAGTLEYRSKTHQTFVVGYMGAQQHQTEFQTEEKKQIQRQSGKWCFVTPYLVKFFLDKDYIIKMNYTAHTHTHTNCVCVLVGNKKRVGTMRG